jgi:hypothetical protein
MTVALDGTLPAGRLAEVSVNAVSDRERSWMLLAGTHPSLMRCTGLNRRQPSATVVGSDCKSNEENDPEGP